MTRRGMTLVEILLTMVMITLVVGAIFTTARQGTMHVYRGGDETLATIYAAEIIETIRGAPFSTFAANGQPMTPEQVFQEHNIPEGVDISQYPPRFRIEATVSPVEPYSPSKIKHVKVIVNWDDRASQKTKSAIFNTFYTPAIK